jgi:transposase/putative transposon-encoded protein
VKGNHEVMEILEAFDLTETYESAGQLTGADPKTVKHWVERRAEGRLDPAPRPRIIDPHLAKIEEWVERSKGKLRADVAHRKLVAMGYTGSERTTRRAVSVAKQAYKDGNRRVYRPWIPEPGMWLQWDWGAGPVVDGKPTLLFCAWLAWSRFRVVIPTRDRTVPTVLACFDQALRRFGGVPTYALTDNEKTVTVDRVAGIPVRHPEIVAAGVHYGIQIRTCQPADPESKGGSEATVKIAKADLVPTDANLLDEYRNFAELEAACEQFCDRVNNRVHRETRRVPTQMLAEERAHLHALPAEPHTAAFGETRVVDEQSVVRFGSARYSVPHQLIGQRVWVSARGDHLICVHVDRQGAREVTRHRLTTPGNPRINPDHYPERQNDPLHPKPRPAGTAEKAFLEIGPGAESWLIEAAASGAQRVRMKMARAVELRALVGPELVDRALGRAAAGGRFADSDLESIIEHLRIEDRATGAVTRALADDQPSLQRSTSAWQELGR